MRLMLLLFTFYLNCRLHAVSVGKPSEWMSNFWTVLFFKSESKPNFGFSHIPKDTVLIMPLCIRVHCVADIALKHVLDMHVTPD